MNIPLLRSVIVLFVLTAPLVAQTKSPINEQNIRAELGFLASDAMQGRGSGTTYERIAAEYIGSQFRQLGLEPGGDADTSGNKGFVQTVALASGATWNAIGILRGSDPRVAAEVIMLSAHLDHLGVREALEGDKIFNGADDDASGCVAVLELARVLAAGKRPRRTVYFVCFGSEERGGLGSRYFIDHSPVPLTQIVADLTFEMLGRPDSKVATGTLWLTGFERSTLGPELARQGAALVADPHPEQNFFRRSDNYPLALRGVIAHTISSFGLHTDYHRPSDEISKIDFPFMTRSLNSLVKPIQWLTNSPFRPAWLPGQAPTRTQRRNQNSSAHPRSLRSRRSSRTMPDLLVNLLKLPALVEPQDFIVRRAQPFELTAVRTFVERNFSVKWADEMSVGFARQPISVYIATIERELAGFSAYECTRRGFFGPTGVVQAARGKGIGEALLLASLWGLRELGYVYAIIGAAGPVRFYQKTVGAIIIPDSEPGIYTDMLKQ